MFLFERVQSLQSFWASSCPMRVNTVFAHRQQTLARRYATVNTTKGNLINFGIRSRFCSKRVEMEVSDITN